MGFIKDDNYFVPNTVIKDDVRQIARRPTLTIVAIYTKSDKQKIYNDLSYIRKNTTVAYLVDKIPDTKRKLSIDML